MSLPIPELDDKTFDELVDEARKLIARFAPEWTDHNAHDPGITFIELFAWLAEMQIYHLNRVTDKNYRKFLKLLGLYPYEARPAKVDICFMGVKDAASVEAGTRVYCKSGSEKIFFETLDRLALSPAKISSVMTGTGDSKIIDYTLANETENIYFAAFGENPTKKSELVLKIEFDGPPSNYASLPAKEFQVTFFLYEKDLPVPGNHADEKEDITPSVKLEWEYSDKDFPDAESWSRLSVKKDMTLALTRSGQITFVFPSDMKAAKIFQIRCRIKEGHYEIPPLVESIKLNTVSAVQIETISGRDLGQSSGLPDQKLLLEKKPVLRKISPDYPLFCAAEILDLDGLLKTIEAQAKPETQGPGKLIWELLDQSSRNSIREWNINPDPNKKGEITDAVVAVLNELIESRNLYRPGSFKETLPVWTKRLLERADILSDEEIKALNRLLTEMAFPGQVESGSLRLQVRIGPDQWETWVEVDDFELSGPEDRHYMLDPEKGEITFGNGLNGYIPPESKTIRVSYKTTLGAGGNIPGLQKFEIDGMEFRGISGTNPEAAVEGKDAESTDDAKARVKKDFREIYRAVTSGDYEYLALHTPGLRVRRAKAIPNYDPDYPCIDIPGHVTVVVVPHTRENTGGEADTLAPEEAFTETVLRHLEKHRLITTDVHVIPPEYIQISIRCRVCLMKKSSPDEVKKRVKDKLGAFLNPLKGGPDGNGWPFGRTVFLSEIYQKIDNAEGVDYATDVFIRENEKEYRKEPIGIPRFGLVFFGGCDIEFV
jgi:hypothetical protein